MGEAPLATFHVYEPGGRVLHAHSEMELCYVVSGSITVHLHEPKHLAAEDLLLLQPDQLHGYTLDAGSVAIGVKIDPDRLHEKLGVAVLLACDSTTAAPGTYTALRQTMRRLASAWADSARLTLEMLVLAATCDLCFECRVQALPAAPQESSRARQVQHYLYRHFREPLTLKSLAAAFYMSETSFSRFFSATFHMGYAAYLRRIRLECAAALLRQTQRPVTEILLECGFSSTSVFNHAFREHYGMTPTQYRRDRPAMQPPPALRERLRAPVSAPARLEHDTAACDGAPYARHWDRFFGLGELRVLLRGDIQAETLRLAQQLQIRTFRVWHLFEAEQYRDGRYHFDRIDAGLDFLVGHGLRPHLELGLKDLYNAGDDIFPTLTAYGDTVRALLAHLAERYGTAEVATWCFELQFREEIMTWPDYFARFALCHHAVKSVSPHCRLGGATLHLGQMLAELEQMLPRWLANAPAPDFLTVCAFSYLELQQNGRIILPPSPDEQLLQKQLQALHQILAAHAPAPIPVYITEFGSTILPTDPRNDGLYKGAFLVKNIIDTIGLADCLAYWTFSDLAAGDEPLHGGAGLVARDGIRKPAFWAMAFCNRLLPQMHGRFAHAIITGDGTGRYVAVCHNYKHPTSTGAFTDEDPLRLRLSIPLPTPGAPGAFQIRTDRVFSGGGSIQNALAALNATGDEDFVPAADDLALLGQAAVPKRTVTRVQVRDGVVSFALTLEPNEICCLDLRPLT